MMGKYRNYLESYISGQINADRQKSRELVDRSFSILQRKAKTAQPAPARAVNHPGPILGFFLNRMMVRLKTSLNGRRPRQRSRP